MTVSIQDATEALADIEKGTPQQIKKKRSHARLAVRAKAFAQPANTSERNRFRLQGVLGDISRGGCLMLLPEPLLVGDIYRLSFERGELDLDPLFARCLRCRLVREDAYEAGFSFFYPVDLTTLEHEGENELLD